MKSNNDMNAVFELDLSAIKRKLMHVESGEGWTLQQADAVEREYKRFLYLMKAFPNEQTVPSVDVDTFWHYHILDTMKYAVDCEQAFGYFLHHYPYVGMEGADNDAEVHTAAAEQMRVLYEDTFGETYPQQIVVSATAATQQDGAIAYCSLITPAANATGNSAGIKPPVAAVAYCGGIKPPAKPAAYCGGIKPPMTTVAYCGGIKPPATFTYCGGIPPANAAAYCGGIPPVNASAYCGGIKPPANDAAYCGGIKPPASQAAYCGGIKPPVAQAGTWKAAA